MPYLFPQIPDDGAGGEVPVQIDRLLDDLVLLSMVCIPHCPTPVKHDDVIARLNGRRAVTHRAPAVTVEAVHLERWKVGVCYSV